MIETGAIQNSGSQAGLTGASSLAGGGIMGKDDFLKLLCVQLQHQDPLSPMKGQEFSAQLAQFSQVEQLENMSTNLSASNELDLKLTQAITNTLSTTLVGKQAKVAGDQVVFKQDGSGSISFKLGGFADDVTITIKDNNGKKIETLNRKGLSQGEHTIDWAGKNDKDLNLSNDTYFFEVKAANGESQKVSVTPMMVGIVNGVRFTENGSFLLLNSQEASFSNVLEIGNNSDTE